MCAQAAPVSPAPVSDLAALVAALSQPDCYPSRPDSIQVLQTHISVVFLAGDVVYKLKKPVQFSFLDYATFASREFFCHEEVRLNRRLAPSVYLGVVPLLRCGQTYRIGEIGEETDGEVVDYLVKMRRLPEERTLGALVGKGEIEKADIYALATKLVDFHQAASRDQAAEYGAPDVIWNALADNFKETAPFVGQTLSATQYEEIRDFSQHFFSTHQALFQKRVRMGRVCEGHGDLRCEHVYFLDEGITVIDCIEFNPGLRTCDVVSEVAFLTMDLERHGRPDLANELASAYSTQTEDPDFFKLLPFYQCYRAYVRGKVSSLKSLEPEVTAEERARARANARRAFRLAHRYAHGTPQPALIVVCGGIGTGKSSVARLLSECTGFTTFNSDVVRKRLAGLRHTTRSSTDYGAGIYTQDRTQRTYAALAQRAQEELQKGHGVILDATCRQPDHRQLFFALGQHFNVPTLFLECQARPTIVEQRLRERVQRDDSVSDANWEIALQHQRDFPPFDDLPDTCHSVVDAEKSAEKVLEGIEDALARL